MDYLSLCLICKDENDYLTEWLDYHILMGVDRFYIYDNESQVSLRESLKEYIELGWVVVLDISGKAMQLYAYDHCLQTFGTNTFWMGFIDTDEFLVPKTTQDLKELLKAYEAYGGLAVSSLFFGSNSHKTRPMIGQIAAYTRYTQSTIGEYEVVKSIVQPGLVLMPNSPHDFIFKENSWCVNEGFLRVDYQRFPRHTEKIQLNHYFCRSEQEINLKLRRGNSQTVVWPRQRFDTLNFTAIYEDTNIHQKLESVFQKTGFVNRGLMDFLLVDGLLEKMAVLARTRNPIPIEVTAPRTADSFRPELAGWLEIKDQWELAKTRGEFYQQIQLGLGILQLYPHYLHVYVAQAIIYLRINDSDAAWQALSTAWQLSPNNNYNVLCGMSIYFLYVENFNMAENTCRLVLELSPHDIVVMGLLVQSLIGQKRYEDALKIGGPVMELAWTPGWELPAQMGVNMVKKLADYLLEKKDYTGAVRLWQAGVQCQPREVNNLLELARCLLLTGDKTGMRRCLTQARSLAPKNEEVLAFLRMDDLAQRAEQDSAVPRVLKRRY